MSREVLYRIGRITWNPLPFSNTLEIEQIFAQIATKRDIWAFVSFRKFFILGGSSSPTERAHQFPNISIIESLQNILKSGGFTVRSRYRHISYGSIVEQYANVISRYI